MWSFSICKWRSPYVASHMPWADMYDNMSIITLILSFMPSISSSLFPVFFFITSQLCRDWALVCMLYIFCIGMSLERCLVVIVISLQCCSWILQLWDSGQWLHFHLLQSSNGGTSLVHGVFLVFVFLPTLSLSTWQAVSSKCHGY